MTYHHEPVLRDAVVRALAPKAGGVYVDCTLGGGGHAAAILAAAACTVIGIDRDPAALEAARARCSRADERLVTVRGSFSELDEHLEQLGVAKVDGVLADLGVSSHQLDTADRGFSFRTAGPLDMRMDPEVGEPASEFIGRATADELADVIGRFGEERHAKRVARAIVSARPIHDTLALAKVVSSVVRRGKSRIHPATRTFQAIRIYVNDELGEVERLLPRAHARLKPCGRVAVISFHSLEDRTVKRFFAMRAGRGVPRDPYGNPVEAPSLRLLRPITSTDQDTNPRARSARLRAAVRLPCPDC